MRHRRISGPQSAHRPSIAIPHPPLRPRVQILCAAAQWTVSVCGTESEPHTVKAAAARVPVPAPNGLPVAGVPIPLPPA